MRQELWLANVRILLWLNHLLAEHPRIYQIGVFLTDTGADLALLATAAWLWFWPSPGRNSSQSGPTRLESRARLLAFGVAAMTAYLVARLIALDVELERPFATYLPVRGTPGAFEGLRTFGTFPSDHAALLGALPIAFSYWSRRLGIIWGILAGFLILLRIAVGFHYPADMLVGAVIGAAFAFVSMELYDKSRTAKRLSDALASGFSHPPYAYALYLGLALVGVEFAMHFSHVLWAILTLHSLMA